MKSKKICAAAIAAVPAVIAAAACTVLDTQTEAAGNPAILNMSVEWAPNWSNKAQTVGNVTLQQDWKIAVEEPEELSNLSAATFSDSFVFQGKAPLKVTYINSDFIGKNADNITISGYEGNKLFDSTTGAFTFYIDADITAKKSDNTTPLWTKTDSETYTYYSPITVSDQTGVPKLSGEINIFLKSVEKKQTESSNSSESSTPNSSTASSSSSGSSNKVKPTANKGTTTSVDDTSDTGDLAAENASTGIAPAFVPVVLAAGVAVVVISKKK